MNAEKHESHRLSLVGVSRRPPVIRRCEHAATLQRTGSEKNQFWTVLRGDRSHGPRQRFGVRFLPLRKA